MICSVASCDWDMMNSPDLDLPHERLAWAREQAGFADKADFARACNVNPTTYRAYESGQNGFAKYAALFAKRLGIAAEWLLEGGPTPVIVRGDRAPDLPPIIKAEDGAVPLRHIDMNLAMGEGVTLDDYYEEGVFEFDAALLRQISRAPAQRLVVGRGIGDSMMPTIHDDAMVIFDTTQTELNNDDKIWAISLYGAASIKRLQVVGRGRVLVVSDNPIVPNKEVARDDIHILGRVIWSARKH